MKFKKFDNQGGGPSLYLKIGEDKPVVVIVRGEFYEFYALWTEGKSSIVAAGTPGAKIRFKVNALVHENGRFVAKIWEFGMSIYEQLDQANQIISDLGMKITETRLHVTRRGQKLDTEYTVRPLLKADQRINPKELTEIESIDLNVLDKGSVPQFEEPMPSAEDEPWQGY